MIVDSHCASEPRRTEANAIVQAAATASASKERRLTCTHQPCVNCSKLLVSAGVKADRVYDVCALPGAIRITLLAEAGVRLKAF